MWRLCGATLQTGVPGLHVGPSHTLHSTANQGGRGPTLKPPFLVLHCLPFHSAHGQSNVRVAMDSRAQAETRLEHPLSPTAIKKSYGDAREDHAVVSGRTATAVGTRVSAHSPSTAAKLVRLARAPAPGGKLQPVLLDDDDVDMSTPSPVHASTAVTGSGNDVVRRKRKRNEGAPRMVRNASCTSPRLLLLNNVFPLLLLLTHHPLCVAFV